MANLITVGTFTSPIEAHIAKGRLETEGINTFIANENHIWANWMYSQALGGVKILVLEPDAEKALEIIKKHINGEFEAELKEEFSDLKSNVCPKCGSRKFKSAVPLLSLLIVLLTLGLFSIIYKIRKENHKCTNCGFRWQY